MDSLKITTDLSQKHTNEELYINQVELLKTFLEKGAISKAQFDKSYHDLTVKMAATYKD